MEGGLPASGDSVLVLCATLAAAEDFVEVRRWGTVNLGFLRRFLPYRDGIPSHDTLNDTINALDGELLATCFSEWVESLREAEPDIVAIDGKTSRRTHDRAKERNPLHLVSAWASRQRLVLGQQACEAKSNKMSPISKPSSDRQPKSFQAIPLGPDVGAGRPRGWASAKGFSGAPPPMIGSPHAATEAVLSLQLYLAFVVAAAALIVIPGPNVTLIIANSLSYGSRHAFTTIAGTTLAQITQLTLTVAGMTTVIAAVAGWFDVLRWLGVAYLLWLGIRTWRGKPAVAAEIASAPPRLRRLFWQGYCVSLTNPKTLLFYAAFLPQFVDPSMPPMRQLVLLSLTIFAIALTFDSLYCLLAGRIRPWLNGRAVEWLRTKVTGGLLIASGVGLAVARRS